MKTKDERNAHRGNLNKRKGKIVEMRLHSAVLKEMKGITEEVKGVHTIYRAIQIDCYMSINGAASTEVRYVNRIGRGG